MENNLKTIILTGASSGLGFETVKKIAKQFKNYRIIMACRNLEKANSKKEEIEKETQNKNLIVMEIDTSSLESVKNFVTNYKNSSYGKIYSLVCNAAVGGYPLEKTKDGFDVVFETNHLGHFLLVNSLIPLMEENGRILVVSSDMHDPPKAFHPNFEWVGAEKLAKPDEELGKSMVRYSYSKLCNLYFTYELIRRIGDKKKLFINAFTPGFIPETGLSGKKKIPAENVNFVKKNFPERVGDLDKSSQALCDLITMEDFKENGKFFDRSTNFIKTSELSYNEKNAKELWDLSESYVKNYY